MTIVPFRKSLQQAFLFTTTWKRILQTLWAFTILEDHLTLQIEFPLPRPKKVNLQLIQDMNPAKRVPGSKNLNHQLN